MKGRKQIDRWMGKGETRSRAGSQVGDGSGLSDGDGDGSREVGTYQFNSS